MVHWRLREIAEPERWNPKKISDATGLAYNTVWGIWTNRSKRADLDTLMALAKLLGVQPGELIGHREPAEKLASKRAA